MRTIYGITKIKQFCSQNNYSSFYDSFFDVLYIKKAVNYQFPKKCKINQIDNLIISYDENNEPIACSIVNFDKIPVDFWLNDDNISLLPDFVVNIVKPRAVDAKEKLIQKAIRAEKKVEIESKRKKRKKNMRDKRIKCSKSKNI